MTQHVDVAVIGGGIVGLAHAWMAARHGLQVALMERSRAAEGASVRNFGMIWPIGQPAGELHRTALRSRSLWQELADHGVVSVEPCGSIHLAHRQDELAVQEEFIGQNTHDVAMLTREQVLNRAPLANPDGLLGGLFSPTELRVNPRIASAQIAAWLTEKYSVDCMFGASVVAIENRLVRVSDGRRWKAERIIVCSGSDLQTLYPQTLAESRLVLCKLQMLKTAPSHRGESSPHLASGLTLRHYAAFRDCPSAPALQARVQQETPELNAYGVHVMASQLASGEVILGDSHEYGPDISPFDKSEIDELILREAKKVFRMDRWGITERWNGIYAKHSVLPVFEQRIEDGVHLFLGTGGAGMTMSFGLVETAWRHWLGETS
jgi:FAD dependent oxidoreductase TIGR03364